MSYDVIIHKYIYAHKKIRMASEFPQWTRETAEQACEINTELGHGVYGVVYPLTDNLVVKIQAFFIDQSNHLESWNAVHRNRVIKKTDEKKFEEELKVFRRVAKSHVTPVFYDGWITNKRCYIVMERMDGTLRSILHKVTIQEFDKIVERLIDINEAFIRKQICLSDLHEENVLYKRTATGIELKVGDLGVIYDFTEKYDEFLDGYSFKMMQLKNLLRERQGELIEKSIKKLKGHPKITEAQEPDRSDRILANALAAQIIRKGTLNESGKRLLDKYFHRTAQFSDDMMQ